MKGRASKQRVFEVVDPGPPTLSRNTAIALLKGKRPVFWPQHSVPMLGKPWELRWHPVGGWFVVRHPAEGWAPIHVDPKLATQLVEEGIVELIDRESYVGEKYYRLAGGE